MVAVVEQLGGAFGQSGLLVLPCVGAHLTQVSSAKNFALCFCTFNFVVTNTRFFHRLSWTLYLLTSGFGRLSYLRKLRWRKP